LLDGKRKAGMTNVDHLSRRIFSFFFKREGGDVDVSIPTRVSRKKTNPTTKPIFIVFIFSFMGRKGVGVYLYIFFIVLSFVKPIKACVNF